MSEIIEYMKVDSDVLNEVKIELKNYSMENFKTKEKIGENLIAQNIVLKKATEVLIDDNYDLINENNVLREQVGEVDEKALSEKKIMNMKLNNFSKGSVVLDRLKRRMQLQLEDSKTGRNS